MAKSGGDKRGRKRRKPTPSERAALLIKAVAHPVRRRILRAMKEAGEARSPVKLARELKLSLNVSSYHVKVLELCWAVRHDRETQVRGTIEHFYESTVDDHPTAQTLLEETREADEPAI